MHSICQNGKCTDNESICFIGDLRRSALEIQKLDSTEGYEWIPEDSYLHGKNTEKNLKRFTYVSVWIQPYLILLRVELMQVGLLNIPKAVQKT
jgi:hypothetical protein